MLQGYFDDSGSEPNSFAFVIAGYILPANEMSALADDWAAVLKQKPQIEYFKMHEAFHGEGQFEGVPLEIRKSKIRDLLALIHKYHPVGIVSFMEWHHYKKFSTSLPGPLRRYAYAPLFFRLIDNVLLYQQAAKIFPQKIQLDFDDQGASGQFAIDWYGMMMSEPQLPPEYRAILEGTPRMLNDRQYVPLQAADMVAWVARNGGTPNLNIQGWEWLYEECGKTIWPYCEGFGEQTWDQIRLALFDPRPVTPP
jgi:hypothetical protein